MKTRVIALALAILALMICCGNPFQQSARAVAIVDDAVIAIIIVALAAMGISFAAVSDYDTAKEWIRDMIDESETDFSGVRYGASSSGNLLMNNLFVRRVAILAEYIKVKLGLVDGSTVSVISPEVTAGGYNAYMGTYHIDKKSSSGGRRLRIVTPSHPDAHFIFCKNGSNGRGALYFDYSSFYVNIQSKNNSAAIVESSKAASQYMVNGEGTGLWYVTAGEYADNFTTTINQGQNYQYYDVSWQTVLQQIYELGVVGSGASLDVAAGTLAIPTDQDIGTNGGVISLPVPWGQGLSQTLRDVPGLVLDEDLAGNTSLTLEDSSAVEDQVSDTAAEQPYVGTNPGEYQSRGLTDVFPFCIPFDLYDFMSCLAADPEAPVVSWRFYVPEICDETITLDLSRFDTVAQIVRTMELLLFIVGLAMVTRDKFLRG